MNLPTLIQVEAELARREKAIPAEGGSDLPAAVEVADRLEPKMRRLFMRAIQEAKGRIPIQELEQALRTGNLQRVLDTLRLAELEGALKVGTTETLQQGYLSGAKVGADQLRRAGINVRFDLMNPRAVAWAESRSSQLVTEIIKVQRIAIQEVVADAFRTGRTVDQVARDLRGFIGLHSRQVRASENLRGKLEAQGLDPDKIDRRVEKYERGLLNQRARTIARSEMVQSAHHGPEREVDDALGGRRRRVGVEVVGARDGGDVRIEPHVVTAADDLLHDARCGFRPRRCRAA